jgi:hypothetical protein
MTQQTNASPAGITAAPAPASTGDDFAFVAEDFSSVNEPDIDTQDTSATPATETANKFKIKYNGQDEEYSLDQLTELAQKGRNYDHVFQEKESLKNAPELLALRNIAKEMGHEDVKTFLGELQENAKQLRLEKRATELEDQGYEHEQALYVAGLELEKAQIAASKQAAEAPDPLVDSFNEMLEAYPETRNYKSFDEYPQEFKDMVNSGTKPIVAYAKHLTAKAEAERQLALQNASVKQRDSGSFKTGESDTKKDPFLEALFTQ